MNNIKTQKFFAFKKEQNQKIVYSCFYKSMMQMRLCGDYSETVVLIEVTQDDNGTYWTWYDYTRDCFNFTASFKQAVEICFPYGSKVEEENGKGKLISVSVKELKELTLGEKKSNMVTE
jgi:hypothetical protein